MAREILEPVDHDNGSGFRLFWSREGKQAGLSTQCDDFDYTMRIYST